MIKPYTNILVSFCSFCLKNKMFTASYANTINSMNTVKHHLGTMYESVNCREQAKRLPKHNAANK